MQFDVFCQFLLVCLWLPLRTHTLASIEQLGEESSKRYHRFRFVIIYIKLFRELYQKIKDVSQSQVSCKKEVKAIDCFFYQIWPILVRVLENGPEKVYHVWFLLLRLSEEAINLKYF